MLTDTTAYLMPLPKKQLAMFIRAEDRAYFAKPVKVHLGQRDGTLTRVTDPARQHTYWTETKRLKREWELTARQLREAQSGGGAPC